MTLETPSYGSFERIRFSYSDDRPDLLDGDTRRKCIGKRLHTVSMKRTKANPSKKCLGTTRRKTTSRIMSYTIYTDNSRTDCTATKKYHSSGFSYLKDPDCPDSCFSSRSTMGQKPFTLGDLIVSLKGNSEAQTMLFLLSRNIRHAYNNTGSESTPISGMETCTGDSIYLRYESGESTSSSMSPFINSTVQSCVSEASSTCG